MGLRIVTRPLADALCAVLLLAALVQGAGAAIIQAKAWLAPVLIERAWRASLAAGGAPVKPWPWADTWPVARLLAGDTGNALAFGPGHALASAPLGSQGLAVIGGHRDTHFAFLQSLAPGAALRLQLVSGEWRHYRVRATEVVDATRERLSSAAQEETLMLVTCYPFDTLAVGGPLRLVVSAAPG